MSAKTSIEWTDRTWNPTRGCSMARGSEKGGCLNCYAARMAARGFAWANGLARMTENGPRWTGVVRLVPEALDEPLRWRKPQRVFVNSMSDLFHESLPFEHIAAVYGVMAACGRHTFQILTKRPQRRLDFHAWLRQDDTPPIARCAYHAGRCRWIAGVPDRVTPLHFPDDKVWPLPNVWEGTSVEDQATADERIPLLLQAPAAVRFVSYEPALGPVTLHPPTDELYRQLWPWYYTGRFNEAAAASAPPAPERRGDFFPKIDWLITGGESGPGARRAQVAWFRSVRSQCRAAGVAFFMKQVGANVIDRNDAGFEAEHETWAEGPDAGRPTDPRAWPTPAGGVEDNIDGYRDDYQGAPVRVHLRDRKGGSMEEWPEDLRVREFPKGATA